MVEEKEQPGEFLGPGSLYRFLSSPKNSPTLSLPSASFKKFSSHLITSFFFYHKFTSHLFFEKLRIIKTTFYICERKFSNDTEGRERVGEFLGDERNR